MKAVGYKQCLIIDAADSLMDIEIAPPSPGPRDLLVRVNAVSVNPVDTKIRKRVAADGDHYQILGWDAAGVVEAIGKDCKLFKIGDPVWYAGAIDRPGANAELHCVDERIVGRKPDRLDFAHAAAMPLTTITAWELLFDRLQIQRGKRHQNETLLVIGAAGGVGSMLVQLAHRLTGVTVVGTASRPESVDWVKRMGAHHVIDHSKPLHEQLHAVGIEEVSHVACLTRSDLHFKNIADFIRPFGKIAIIDDPGEVSISPFKTKSVSVHWELMYTRSLFQTPDMIEQHYLLNEVAELVDAGLIQTTYREHYGSINAANLKKAHAMLESGKSIGKIVLEGF